MAFETALIELASNVIQHADAEGVTCVLSWRPRTVSFAHS
jgi:anti-sigma regulatory factor (Ser/Thr protein kinase)